LNDGEGQDAAHLGVGDDRAPLGRRHHSFPSASLSTWMFSAWSATIRFSRRFSSSSALSRCSSAFPSPLYCRFQR
jgi:hypothetical protein